MRVHGGLLELPGAAAVRLFDEAFGGRAEDGQQTPTGADLRRVGTVALAGRGRVEPVDCAANVLPLRYFDAVGEDLDGQRAVGNFLSKGIQLCCGWIAGRSHLLCSFPFLKSSVHLRAGEKSDGRVTLCRQASQHVTMTLLQHGTPSPHHILANL